MSPIQSASAQNQPKSQPKSKTAGFSLLEVMAALVVTTLLIMALTPLVTQMLATWSRGSNVAWMVEFRVNGLGVLRDDLRHAIVWTGFGRFDNLLVFRGNETSMSFPAISGVGPNSDGLHMVSIDVTNSADGQAIIRRRAPIIGTTYAAFGDPVVLFSGPNRYFFSYYSRDGDQKPIWTDPINYPARIALNILDRRGRVSSVSIEIPIMASISAACVDNASLPGCPEILKPPEDDPLKDLTQVNQ
jgi:Prokaryotic N-terminal methylation motif